MAALSSVVKPDLYDIPKDLPAYALHRVKSALRKINGTMVEVDPICRENALRWVFHNATQSLYRKVDFSKEKFTIIVAGRVGLDGMQDYFNMIAVANALKKVFVNAKIIIGVGVEDLRYRKNQFAVPSGFETHFWAVNFVGEFKPTPEGERKPLEIMAPASLVFDVSNAELGATPFRFPERNYARILEYGINAQKTLEKIGKLYPVNLQEAKNNAMGVAPFECGLLWSDFSNQKVGLQFLTEKKLAEFITNKGSDVFHFADIRKKADEFIATCIAYNKSNDRQVIDVVVPCHSSYSMKEDFYEWLKGKGLLSEISKIQFFEKSAEKIYLRCEKKVQDTGKILRLIDPFPLPPEDVHQLMALSSGFVGSSEDAMLSETLSMKQVPYYEMLPEKANFWISLCKLAEEFDYLENQEGHAPYQIAPYLSNFIFSKMPTTSSGGMAHWDDFISYIKSDFDAAGAAKFLQNPALKPALQKFIDFLQKHYNYNEVLVDIASRKLLLQKPLGGAKEIRESEERLCRAYLKDEKSLVECYNELDALLSAYKEDKKS